MIWWIKIYRNRHLTHTLQLHFSHIWFLISNLGGFWWEVDNDSTKCLCTFRVRQVDVFHRQVFWLRGWNWLRRLNFFYSRNCCISIDLNFSLFLLTFLMIIFSIDFESILDGESCELCDHLLFLSCCCCIFSPPYWFDNQQATSSSYLLLNYHTQEWLSYGQLN